MVNLSVKLFMFFVNFVFFFFSLIFSAFVAVLDVVEFFMKKIHRQDHDNGLLFGLALKSNLEIT